MFITLEDLERYKACENGKRYIRRFHPQGFEMSELVHDRHIPRSFVHWARNNLPCTDQEIQLYNKRMNIQNSENFHCSHNISNSAFVKYSWNVEDSFHIFNSENIKNSQDIVRSEEIENSKKIYFSQFVDESAEVYISNNINQSSDVVNSSMVTNSSNVIDSFNIFNSSEIESCNNLTNCFFCSHCKNLLNCLFCFGIEDKEYFVFNEFVGPERYELFKKQYDKIIKSEKIEMCTWPPEKILVIQKPKRKNISWEYYKEISSKLKKWAKTLPGFSEELFYKLTLNPHIEMV